MSKLCESNDNFHGCLVSAFNIFVQLMFTRSQSTMFRAPHSVHFIRVSMGQIISFSTKISLSHQNNNYWLSQIRTSLLKFSTQWVRTVSGVIFCSPRSKIYLLILLILFEFFLTNPRYPIPNSGSSILDPWSWFSSTPRSLFFFSSTGDRICGPTHSGKAQYGISILWTWSAGSSVLDIQVQSYP